jgi:hypothetical protein
MSALVSKTYGCRLSTYLVVIAMPPHSGDVHVPDHCHVVATRNIPPNVPNQGDEVERDRSNRSPNGEVYSLLEGNRAADLLGNTGE